MQIFKKAGNGGGGSEDEDFGQTVLEVPNPAKIMAANESSSREKKARESQAIEQRRASACCVCGC